MARAREERERKWKLQQEEAKEGQRGKENEEKLKKAINALEQKEVHKMAELVSKYSKKSLNNVTSGYRGIRKSGTIDQIKKSLIERVDDWVNQIMEIERLNASISRNATIEELVSIEEIIGNDGDNGSMEVDRGHPLIKRKARNLNKRVASRKEKLERGRKEGVFMREMLQTRDVPNATLNRRRRPGRQPLGGALDVGGSVPKWAFTGMSNPDSGV